MDKPDTVALQNIVGFPAQTTLQNTVGVTVQPTLHDIVGATAQPSMQNAVGATLQTAKYISEAPQMMTMMTSDSGDHDQSRATFSSIGREVGTGFLN